MSSSIFHGKKDAPMGTLEINGQQLRYYDFTWAVEISEGEKTRWLEELMSREESNPKLPYEATFFHSGDTMILLVRYTRTDGTKVFELYDCKVRGHAWVYRDDTIDGECG